jgi:nuclear pore complex protein Nup133
MFSPEASVQSARSSLRGTRRRQRESNGTGHDQPRRKRSKIAEDGASQATGAHINGNGVAIMNGHAGHSSVENSLVLVDMPVREKKAGPKRTLKEDSAQYLVRACRSAIWYQALIKHV